MDLTTARRLWQHLGDIGADPEGCADRLVGIINRCREGVPNQVNTARGDVVDIIQTKTEVELGATKELIDLMQWSLERLKEAEGAASTREVPRVIFEIVEVTPNSL